MYSRCLARFVDPKCRSVSIQQFLSNGAAVTVDPWFNEATSFIILPWAASYVNAAPSLYETVNNI